MTTYHPTDRIVINGIIGNKMFKKDFVHSRKCWNWHKYLEKSYRVRCGTGDRGFESHLPPQSRASTRKHVIEALLFYNFMPHA